MDRRIVSFIVFAVVGFFAAEGSEAMLKEGGIKNILSGYYHGSYGENKNQDALEGINSNGVLGQEFVIAQAEPPIPPPPIPD